MKDYSGKPVYIGIDVHKKTYAVAAHSEGMVVKRDTLPASPSRLIDYIHKYFRGGDIYTAYEAGFCGFALHRELQANGINSKVVHPAGIEIASRDRVKTDKRDALKIAVQLANGRLKGNYVPPKLRENYREVSRLRDTFVVHKNRASAQLKSFLHRQGLFTTTNDKVFSKKTIEALLSKDYPSEIAFCIRQYVYQWLEIKKHIDEIDATLKEQAGNDSLESIYRSIPGVGPTTARVLANELGDLSQFSNENKLSSYIGLTPTEHSSGEHKWLGHISRQGKSIVRKVLVQAAWRAVTIDPVLKETFERISSRAGKRRAIIAIARRMIGHARACFKSGKAYGQNREADSENESACCDPAVLSCGSN